MLGNVHVHIFPLYHWYLFIFSINKPLCPAKSLHLDKEVWRQVFTSLTTQCTCHSHLWLNLWVSELGTLHLSHIVLNDLNLSLTWIWTVLRSVICTILIDIDLLNHDHWKSVLGTQHFTALFSETQNSDIVFCNPNNWRSVLGNSHLFDLVFSNPYLLRLVQMPVGSPSDSPPLPSASPSPCWAPTGGHGGR